MLARTVELGIGTHHLGSKTSLQAVKGNELECTEFGVIAKSGKNGRRILIPWPNVRALELMPEQRNEVVEEISSEPVRRGRKPKDATA